MSQAPHAPHLRNGQKMGDLALVDTMIKDGLWDAFHGYHMGQTAENIAARWQITREDQDTLRRRLAEPAPRPPRRPASSTDEIVAGDHQGPQGRHRRRPGRVHPPRRDATRASAGLRPAFTKEGSVTAANASGLNDGAAALVLMTADEAKKRGLKPLARIVLLGQRRRRAGDHGHRPDPGQSKKALEKAGWTVSDLDLVETNEAFAAQALCVRPRAGPRPGQGQRQRRRHRHRPPDRRVGRAHPDHPAARDEALGRQEGPGDACASAAAWACAMCVDLDGSETGTQRSRQ